MAGRVHVIGSATGAIAKGASGRDIVLRHYRAVMMVSIALILFQFA